MRHHTTIRAHLRYDRIRNRSLVERISALLLDKPQRVRQLWITNNAIQRWHLTVIEEGRRRVGVAAQLLSYGTYILMSSLCLPPAFISYLHRSGKCLLEAHCPEAI